MTSEVEINTKAIMEVSRIFISKGCSKSSNFGLKRISDGILQIDVFIFLEIVVGVHLSQIGYILRKYVHSPKYNLRLNEKHK